MRGKCLGFHVSEEAKRECAKVLGRASCREVKELLGSNYDFLVNLCKEKGYTQVEGLYVE
jgi:hypothetical protein